MDETYEIDKMSDDEALMVLFLLLFQKSSEIVSGLWLDFEKEVKYNNRFYPESELLRELEKLTRQAEVVISKGEIYYRARVIDSSFLWMTKKYEKSILDMVVRHYPEMQGKDARQIYLFLNNLKEMIQFDSSLKQEIENFFKKRKRFWGYNTNESDAPPSDLVPDGRANPKYVSYLYLADSEKTAISEVRPKIGQAVSVAKIRIDRELRIYDFGSTNYLVNQDDLFTLSMISELFSEQKNTREEEYYCTQCICEYIKHLGYDGIRFKSSLNQDGRNTVLFDTKKNKETGKKNYTILNSKVYYISKYDIQYRQVAPFVENSNM